MPKCRGISVVRQGGLEPHASLHMILSLRWAVLEVSRYLNRWLYISVFRLRCVLLCQAISVGCYIRCYKSLTSTLASLEWLGVHVYGFG
jgi:hypothetical protein